MPLSATAACTVAALLWMQAVGHDVLTYSLSVLHLLPAWTPLGALCYCPVDTHCTSSCVHYATQAPQHVLSWSKQPHAD